MPSTLPPIPQSGNGLKCPRAYSISGAALKVVEALKSHRNMPRTVRGEEPSVIGHRCRCCGSCGLSACGVYSEVKPRAGVTPSLPKPNSTEKQGVASQFSTLRGVRRFKSDRQAAGARPIAAQVITQPVEPNSSECSGDIPPLPLTSSHGWQGVFILKRILINGYCYGLLPKRLVDWFFAKIPALVSA